jgi:hypothetical protein
LHLLSAAAGIATPMLPAARTAAEHMRSSPNDVILSTQSNLPDPPLEKIETGGARRFGIKAPIQAAAKSRPRALDRSGKGSFPVTSLFSAHFTKNVSESLAVLTLPEHHR